MSEQTTLTGPYVTREQTGGTWTVIDTRDDEMIPVAYPDEDTARRVAQWSNEGAAIAAREEGAVRRDASRVTTVLGALLTAEREVIAAARAALTIEDEDVRDALVSTLQEQRRALHTLRYQISET